jgi:hypothetical protein
MFCFEPARGAPGMRASTASPISRVLTQTSFSLTRAYTDASLP